MDSESAPPSYASSEHENNLNFNAQNQEDQQERNNRNSESIPQLIEIPNSVSLIQIIDDDIIEVNDISHHVECNESIIQANSNSAQEEEEIENQNQPQEGRILKIPETVGHIKLMNEDIIYDKLVTNNEKKLMMVLRLKYKRKSVDKPLTYAQFIKKHTFAFTIFTFWCCAFIGSIIFNVVMVQVTNEKLKNHKPQRQIYHNSATIKQAGHR
ncbi:uncharacterized protein KGF55_001921 [Candida pseudojiufengensis]|uniref:uncharacterized protein n=1 Tax=Candida pseudojiufengensis TaxID=497109 RepID=UPI0022244C81|nr:uncharacterized protein KGF55_001921 [Candida pseudojiufengensis]KAI5964851.1 hypothetical protein KGF55_001921 [Candida pseudojiufengensis]